MSMLSLDTISLDTIRAELSRHLSMKFAVEKPISGRVSLQ